VNVCVLSIIIIALLPRARNASGPRTLEQLRAHRKAPHKPDLRIGRRCGRLANYRRLAAPGRRGQWSRPWPRSPRAPPRRS
jgi:hypothetical protein